MNISLFLVIIPVLAAVFFNFPKIREFKKTFYFTALVICICEIIISLSLDAVDYVVPAGKIITLFMFDVVIDPLSIVMFLISSLVVLCALMVSWRTTNNDKHSDVVSMFLISLAGMNGLVMVKDLFSMYVFLEVMSVASFILIAVNKDIKSLEGSFKYLIMSAVATLMLLSSIAILMLYTGSTSFSITATNLMITQKSFLIMLALGLFVSAAFIKGGVFPFHAWVPDAYTSAPASVSVLLAGAVTKIAGVYTLIRFIVSVSGFDEHIKTTLLLFGTLSILAGALLALTQRDFKRMLAYSSISQIGYIIASLGCGTTLGAAAAIFHFFNHTVFKAQLFVNAAALEKQAGTLEMDRLGGLSQKMPVTGATSVIAMLSTAGVPPFGGFWSKLLIIIALWISGNHIYAFIAVLASVLTLAYMLYMQRNVFFGKLAEGLSNVKEAPLSILVPSVLLAAITVVVGVLFPFMLNAVIFPINMLVKLF